MTLSVVLRSSIFRKALAAVTGVLLFFFLIGHLAGNLGIFAGQSGFNGYAHFLKSKPLLLWGARLGLLATLTLHVYLTFMLTMENRSARPQPYAVDATRQASKASQVMLVSGALLLAFIIFHLLHFTAGVIYPSYARLEHAGHPDAYGMVINGFSHGWVVLVYLAAMLVLFSHLSHGISSLFQTLGLKHPRYSCLFNCGGKALAVLIFLGYVAIPISIRLGYLK